MILVFCVDDNGGLLFNRRRLSQDRALREDLLREVNGRILWMNTYSAKQFDPPPQALRTAEDFPDRAGPGEFCFVETADPAPWSERAEQIILYRWNRRYPSDLRCTLSLEDWTLERQEEFPGYSHETITKEVYRR